MLDAVLTDRPQVQSLSPILSWATDCHGVLCRSVAVLSCRLERMNTSVQEQGSQLLQLAAEPTLQLAAASAHHCASQSDPEQQQQQQRHSQVPQEPLDQMEGLEWQLLRVSDKLHRNMVSVLLFMVNILTKYQLAVLSVACFPRIVSVFPVAHVVHKRVQQQQQALLAAVERTARQTGTIPSSLVEARLFGLGGSVCSSAASSVKTATHSSMLVARYNLQEHEQQRMAQLLHHQQVCWEQLGCQTPQQEPCQL
jgi:hypothetical protein